MKIWARLASLPPREILPAGIHQFNRADLFASVKQTIKLTDVSERKAGYDAAQNAIKKQLIQIVQINKSAMFTNYTFLLFY